MTQHARKPCRDCGAVLTLRHFHLARVNRDGRKNSCKACCAKYAAENRELKREAYRPATKIRNVRNRHLRQAYERTPRGKEVRRAIQQRSCRLKKLFEART